MMGNDEFLSFYSDSVPTFGDVLHVQLHTPISLDPPTYHLLSHLGMDVLGRNATALRLPALLGFLLMQGSLFVLVRRLAGHRASLIAMVLPLCTASFRYAVEGRPYALLLGLYAASPTCWFLATQHGETAQEAKAASEPPEDTSNTVISTGARALFARAEWRNPHFELGTNASDTKPSAPPSPRSLRLRWVRTLPLVGLFLTITMAITSHYFGILILLPISIGEAARTLHRRPDWPMLATLAAGTASIAFILPFKTALAPYTRHYYTSTVNLRNVSQGYRELFVRYNDWPMPLQRILALALAAAVLGLLILAFRRFRHRPATEPTSLIAALLPFVVSLALLLAPALRHVRFFYATFATACALALLTNSIQIHTEQRDTARLLAAIQQPLPPTLKSTTEPIYIQTLSDFFLRTYYTTDAALRSRYVLLYDADRELHWLHHDTNAVTAAYLQHFTTLRTARFADMTATNSAIALIAPPGGWNWLLPDLNHVHGLTFAPLGTMGTMQLVRIHRTASDGGGNPHTEAK